MRLRILPLPSTVNYESSEGKEADDATDSENFYKLNNETNGSATIVNRLPLLPD